MKVAVYAIALNEEKHVERFLSSAADADLVLVADTGSTDGTRGEFRTHQRARGSPYEVDYSDISIRPFRFDHARNAALALVPADVDVCIALDLDEVLKPGWREALERQWKIGETTRANYRFVLDAGKGSEMVGVRIHARHAYDWRHPCHEALYAKRGVAERVDYIDGLEIEHLQDKTKDRSGYVKMLEAAVADAPEDSRMLFYYGRELMYGAQWGESYEVFKRYLATQDGWKSQRAEAMRYMARCCFRRFTVEEGGGWLLQACLECPDERINWLEFAENCRQRSDWAGGLWGIQKALNCEPRPPVGYFEPWQLDVGPYDIGSLCAWYLGLSEQAIAWANQALFLDPHNERLVKNLALMTQA